MRGADGNKAEPQKHAKKHSCPDCSFCQCCSESRCNMCRPKAGKKTKKDKTHKPLFLKF